VCGIACFSTAASMTLRKPGCGGCAQYGLFRDSESRLVQHAKGYEATFVNGTQIVSRDEFTGELPGKLLRGRR